MNAQNLHGNQKRQLGIQRNLLHSRLASFCLFVFTLSLAWINTSQGQQQMGEGALQGEFSADAETRVVVQADGRRTTYERNRKDLRLEAITYESLESDVVVQRKEYELGPQGHEKVCWTRDAKGNLLFTVVYLYDKLGRRSQEGTYNAKGQLERVVGFFWKDGRPLKPVVTQWRQDGVMWVHAPDGSGVIPKMNQEKETGLKNEDLENVVFNQKPIEAAFTTDTELRRAILNNELPKKGGMISLDKQIQTMDAKYMEGAQTAEEILILEQWRRKNEALARQK